MATPERRRSVCRAGREALTRRTVLKFVSHPLSKRMLLDSDTHNQFICLIRRRLPIGGGRIDLMSEPNLGVGHIDVVHKPAISRREFFLLSAFVVALMAKGSRSAKSASNSELLQKELEPATTNFGQLRAYSEQIRPLTGISTRPASSGLWESAGNYASDNLLTSERAITTAIDLITCGPVIYSTIAAGSTLGWGEALGVFVIAKCIPELMADAFANERANQVIHSGMDLILPQALAFAAAANLTMSPDYTFTAAAVGNMTSDLRDLLDSVTKLEQVDSWSIIEGFIWLHEQEDLMQEMEDRLRDRMDIENQTQDFLINQSETNDSIESPGLNLDEDFDSMVMLA